MELIDTARHGTFWGRFSHGVDWVALTCALFISLAGLVTMHSFSAENPFFERQLLWLAISLVTCLSVASFDLRFLRRTSVVVTIFAFIVALLTLVFALGATVKGAQSWFHIGGFALQPSELAKLALIIVLAKYFSRRHIEIAHVRHIFVSGGYTFLLFVLVFLQPDFGSAIILACIWLGMVLVAGISWKHLALVFVAAALAFGGLWFFAFEEYQKDRIMTFLNPLTDIQGAGYNAYQSTVAVGSGEFLGKGVGYGTQSKLQFLPEYETDFIFAAFAEEWGFVGVLLLFGLYAVLLWRILAASLSGGTNFEMLFSAGVAVLFLSHIVIHIGMNIGLLPVTGTTTPFMSYGGSHLLAEYIALGMVLAMRRYGRAVHREDAEREMVGVQAS